MTNEQRLRQAPESTPPKKSEFIDALENLVRAVEADYKCQGVDPRNMMKAHTWIALAMKDADKILERHYA